MLRKLTPVASAAAVLLALCASLVVASPAQAVSYRDLKSARYGSCHYAYSDPVEGHFLERCSTTPARYGNWAITRVGYYNNHPLWVLKRQKGTCLGVGHSSGIVYLHSSCNPKGSKNVWEVFTTASGRYVLKSFGAYQSWRRHSCLNFNGADGGAKPQLGACSLTSTVGQIYR